MVNVLGLIYFRTELIETLCQEVKKRPSTSDVG